MADRRSQRWRAAVAATAQALWHEAPGRAVLRSAPAAPPDDPAGRGDRVLVAAELSAISRGTERLVFEGRVPTSEQERMRAPFQEGAFSFPVKYGYAAVGRVVAAETAEGDALIGRRVFALHPHQNLFAIPRAAAHPVPDATPSRRAALAANFETALNAVWDARLGPGDRVAIVGAGVIGALTAGLAAALPGVDATLIDVETGRAALAERLGCAFALPDAAAAGAGEADVVIHASASEAGLALSLALAGVEARVVEMSWHGDRAPRAPLGEAFHSRRLQLISSQVAAVPAERRGRWPLARRLAKAIEMLADPRYEALIGREIALADAPAALPEILGGAAGPGLATLIRHPAAEPTLS